MNKKQSDRSGRYFKIDKYCLEEKMPWNCSVDSDVEKRYVFFYYMLVSNIVLLVIVGILVLWAGRVVYFN